MASSSIYTGLWLNHSRNSILGATLTLSSNDGAILIAFLATLVTAAGSAAWRISKYALHQTRSNNKPHDALFYQQQVILKNSSSALGSTLTFLRVPWAWRKHERRRIWKSWTLLFVVVSVLLSVLFTIAAIFSSQVTQGAGVAFLIRSPNCGLWEFDAQDFLKWEVKVLNDSHVAEDYARACYNGGSGNPRLCETYKVPNIEWTTDQNASCPFASEACDNFSTPLSMDTGYLDSHEIFGLNAVHSERVVVRKKVSCSPLRLRQWASEINQTVGAITAPVDDIFIAIDIGKYLESDLTGYTNHTYTWNAHNLFVDRGYDLTTRFASASHKGLWEPIPEFNRTDADVTVFFLAQNSMLYMERNNDTLFAASTPLTGTTAPFKPDRPLAGLGCMDQYQICNPLAIEGPNTMKCTPLTGIFEVYKTMAGIDLNEHQLKTWQPIWRGLQHAGMDKVVDGRDSSVLKAQETVYLVEQTAALPSNQWQIELFSWHAVTLARLQAAVVEHASGPRNVLENGGRIIKPQPDDKVGQAICQRQMVLNVPGYQNFSMLGVTIILVFSACLIFVGWTIETLVGLVQKCCDRHYKRLTWVEDESLQLQRMACDGARYMVWEGGGDDVPRTREKGREGQHLMGLDLGELEHPRIAPMERWVPPLMEKKNAVQVRGTRSMSFDSLNRASIDR